MNPHLELLLDNRVYSGALHPLHRADLYKSKLSDETIAAQRIRSVPPNMIGQLLGFNMPGVVSAMLIPFADPAGGFMDFPRMKIFPTLTKESGRGKQKKTTHIKYLQPKASGVRLFFPIATMRTACESMETLYVVEGEKKSLALAQHFGVPVVAICGVDGWHAGGEDALMPDFDKVRLEGRVVKVIPDGDVETNPNVERAVWAFGAALDRRGARPELVHLPADLELAA